MPNTYNMRHLELTVPETLNAWHQHGPQPSHYVDEVRFQLEDLDFPGWTEHRGIGWWHGQEERVTVFTIYVPVDGWRVALATIGTMARNVMAEQEAIQVVDHGEVTLAEY